MKTATLDAIERAFREVYHCGAVTALAAAWLVRYEIDPGSAISTEGSDGEFTKALFRALRIKQPRTKQLMLCILEK